MNEWKSKYDPIIDIDDELKHVQSNIEVYRQSNRPKNLRKEEEKLALLLQIIEAQNN